MRGDAAHPDVLQARLGKNGLLLFASGLDAAPVMPTTAEAAIKSIGNGTTTPQDIAAIDAAKAELNNAWQTASAQMYQQTGAQPGAGAGFQGGPQQPGAGSSSANNENVQDADFEEVK